MINNYQHDALLINFKTYDKLSTKQTKHGRK